MKCRLLLISLFFSIANLNAQFITSSDTVLCTGDEITLVASGANISPSLVNVDDIHSSVIDLGFDFTFYGNTYNQCVISANGYITFDLTQNGQVSPWDINFAIPNAGEVPENAILAPWHDIDPFVGGNIVFGTYGAAPNRVFYVVWCNVPMYSDACNNLLAGQYALMFESSNKIEIHIDEKPLCAGWNDGAAIQGIVNENSTLFEIVNDPVLLQPRNYPLNWTASDEGWEFIPNADFTDYEINAIDYNPIATGSVVWSDQYGNIISDSLTLTVTPDTGDVYYYISVVDVCTDQTINFVDSVLIQTSSITNAGFLDQISEDSTIILCDLGDSEIIDLRDYLGDTYQEDGTWFLENNIVSSQFILNENSTGDYSYITYGVNNNCNDTSFINLTINTLPDAGEEGFKLVCSGDPEFLMIDELNSNPQSGGIWYNQNLEIVPDVFDPSTSEIGVFSYVIEGLNACPSDSQKLTITYQEGFEIFTYPEPVSCNGFQDGSITLLVENNTVAPIVYSIDNGNSYGNVNIFENLDYGTYQVSIKDGNGCISKEEVIVNSSAPSIDVLTSAIDVDCPGDSEGTVFVSSISGGNLDNSSYEYYWFNSSSDELVGQGASINVPAGGYYLVAKDDNGCQGTDEVSVEEPNQLTYSISTSDIVCYGENNGQIEVQITGGGTAPYELKWINQGNDTSSFLYNLSAGNYDLEIKDAKNCLTSTSVELNQSPLPLTIEVYNVNVSCFGDATGSANVSVNGGTPPYSYQWSSGHVTSQAFQMASGDYTITVTDSRGCSVEKSVSIEENEPIVNLLSSLPISCYGGNNGSALVTSSGGTGNLIYNWSNGDASSLIFDQSYGDYWVKVEDELGCYKIDTIKINQPSAIKVQLTTKNVKCFGGADGVIESNVNGGTPPYSYDWSLGQNSFDTNPIATGLPATNVPYVFTVTDANSCPNTVLSFINQPESLSIDTSHLIPAYCLNIATGEVSVIAEGGFLNTNSAYSFNWNTGETGSILTNKKSGMYSVIVEDDNSCKDTLNIEIPLIETFTLGMTTDSLNCFGDESGSASVILSGGYGPYDYVWNSNNEISQTTSLSNSNTLLNLTEGFVSVVVSDVNGCTKTSQINIHQPDELIFTAVKLNDESCSGEVSSCDGSLQLTASGGIGTYDFSWLDLEDNLIGSFSSDSLVIASSLCSGYYQFVVQDERGCLAVPSGNGIAPPLEIIPGSPVEAAINTSLGSITNNILCFGDTSVSLSVSNPNPSYSYDWYVNDQLTASGTNVLLPAGNIYVRAVISSCYTNSDDVIIYQPSILSINQEVESVNCNGGNDGSISIEASGGFPNYSYLWVNSLDTLLGSTDLSELSADIYSLTLGDANGCKRQFNIEIEEPMILNVNSVVEDANCKGSSDGSASLEISGGIEPYTINWQGVDSTALFAGNYPVTVVDANSCLQTINITINEPSLVSASFNANQIPFNGSASGGTPPYTYKWLYFGNYQASGMTFTPSLEGEYTLVVTDANDCDGRKTNTYNSVDIDKFKATEIIIYPNPVKDNFVIEVQSNSSNNEDYTFKLIDSRGRILLKEDFKQSIQIDRQDLSAGIYIIQLNSASNFMQQKIIFSDQK